MQDLPRLLGRVRVVRHHDDRLVEFVVQALQQPQDLLGGLLVELSRRLVEQDERGIGNDRPRDGDALLLAARKRSEEHTSELQSQSNLVCRLLLEKKKNK